MPQFVASEGQLGLFEAQPKTIEAQVGFSPLLSKYLSRQGRTRAVPSLPQVLDSNVLPAPEPLAPGEQVMLERQHLVEFHVELQVPSRYKVAKGREGRHFLK